MATEQSGAQQSQQSKAQKFAVRTGSTLSLLAVFFVVMWAGHIPCALVLFGFQVRALLMPS